MNPFETIRFYLENFAFVRYALVVGVLIALCASLLGVTLVLKRYSFIGDGLSHVAFGAMSVAAVVNVSNDLYLIMPVTVVAAVVLLCAGQNAKIKGDAAVAMISVSTLAFGYMVINLFSASANVSGDVCSSLFGSTSILTLRESDLWLCIGMSVLVIGVFVLFYHKIFAVTFDEDFAMATGVRAKAYNLLLAVVTAVVISLSMRLVGSLLISALIIFPALSAMRLFKNFRSVVLCSGIISVAGAFLGILVSIVWSTPVGSTIVMVDLAIFLLFCLGGAVLKRN